MYLDQLNRFGTRFVRSSPEGRHAWPRANGIPDDASVIGCVARLVALKEHTFLINAFASLASEHGDVHLVLVGDGPLRGPLEAQTALSG